MLGRTDSRLRLVLLLCLMVCGAGALGLRLAYWQIGQGPDLRRMADAQQARPVVAGIERGDIIDRNGEILASTAYRDLLAAYPDVMANDPEKREATAERLAAILGYDADRGAQLLTDLESDARYLIVEKQLTRQQSDLVRAGLESGALVALDLDPLPVRFYPSAGGSPDTTLASQLLGFVTEDGQGRYGVEQASQELLAGAGATADALGMEALPPTGGTVQLTIDAGLQLALERELQAAYITNRAERVSGVIMDPYTGEILAWASVPGYDANDYAHTADRSPATFTDPIISQVYEPGSVMKMFTAAAAIEQGVVGPTTLVEDAKTLRLGDNVVRNFDNRSMGEIPFEDVIAHSRNVATGRVALSLGQTTEEASNVLYDMWQRLGIGHRTGIELRNESVGLVSSPEVLPWHAIDTVNRAFGQAVAVTPLQLTTAFAAMVNGGLLPTPHIYAALDGQAQTAPAAVRAISPELSATLRDIMVHVAEAGPHYAEETLIPGYVVGGKTGTAQIWDRRTGSWLPNIYNHTFVGFVGAERPEAVILVRIHDTEPREPRRWGMALSMTTNQVFRRVAQATIDELDIRPLSGIDLPAPTDEPAAAEPAAASVERRRDGPQPEVPPGRR